MKSKNADKTNVPPPPPVAAKRPAPPKVPAVSFESVRYEQAYEGKDESFAQRSGFLRASSEATGDALWTLKIYNVEIDATLERDVQEVYFATLSVDGQARTIVVENERGRAFLVNIDTREITAQ